VIILPLAVTAGLLDDNLSMESYLIVVTETDYTRQDDGFDGESINDRETNGHRSDKRHRSSVQEDQLGLSKYQLKSPLRNIIKPKLRKGPTTKTQRRPSFHHSNSLNDKTNREIKISVSKTPSYWINYLYAPQSTHDNPPQLAHN
jgi:hypothetical protein